MMKCLSVALAAGVAVSALFASGYDAKAAYPERPITMIVPYAAGGGTDMVARAMAVVLEQELGVPVNIVNRTGGGGIVGTHAIANAAPDGYTLGFITNELLAWHWQNLTDLTYREFVPLAQFTEIPSAVTVAYESPYETVEDLLDAVRENPGEMTASGTTVWHIGMLGMLKAAGIAPDAVRWVPAQGGAPAIQDVAAGGVDFATANAAEAQSLIEVQRVRTIAIMADERVPAFPDIPTLKEAAGLDWAFGVVHGVGGPLGLPQEVIDVIVPALERTHGNEEFRRVLDSRGITASWKGPEDFAAYLAATDEELGVIIQEAGLAQ